MNDSLKPIVAEIAQDAINAVLKLSSDKELPLSKEAIADTFQKNFEREIALAAQRADLILCATLTGLAADYVNKMKLTQTQLAKKEK